MQYALGGCYLIWGAVIYIRHEHAAVAAATAYARNMLDRNGDMGPA